MKLTFNSGHNSKFYASNNSKKGKWYNGNRNSWVKFDSFITIDLRTIIPPYSSPVKRASSTVIETENKENESLFYIL